MIAILIRAHSRICAHMNPLWDCAFEGSLKKLTRFKPSGSTCERDVVGPFGRFGNWTLRKNRRWMGDIELTFFPCASWLGEAVSTGVVARLRLKGETGCEDAQDLHRWCMTPSAKGSGKGVSDRSEGRRSREGVPDALNLQESGFVIVPIRSTSLEKCCLLIGANVWSAQKIQLVSCPKNTLKFSMFFYNKIHRQSICISDQPTTPEIQQNMNLWKYEFIFTKISSCQHAVSLFFIISQNPRTLKRSQWKSVESYKAPDKWISSN